jgi:hypothetical protein
LAGVAAGAVIAVAKVTTAANPMKELIFMVRMNVF